MECLISECTSMETRDSGFSSAVCLCEFKASYDPYSLKVLFSAELEYLHHGNFPYNSDTLEWPVRKATNVIREEMNTGKGIVVYCVEGISRTGTVLERILKDLGFQADEVINYLEK